jgi:hypothetical protein
MHIYFQKKFENYKSTVQKAFTIRKVVFGVNESMIDLKDLSAEELSKKAEELTKVGAVSFAPDIAPQRPQFGGIIQNANYAINAGNANYANYAGTASYVNLGGIQKEHSTLSISSEEELQALLLQI